MALDDQTLASFLSATADPTPAPGGGSSAAVSCALGAALVEMAAGIEIARRPGGGVHADLPARVRAIREQALRLAQGELTAYAPVLAARRLARDEPQRAERLESALVAASRSPLQIAEAAAAVATLGAAVAAASDKSVRGDARTGVLVAEAAAAAALGLVETNLGSSASAEAAEIVRQARAAHQRAAKARAATS